MRILILHRIPYYKVDYHRGINHDQHDVVYLGTELALGNIPAQLRCEKWSRPGVNKTELEAIDIVTARGCDFDLVLSLSEYELMSAAIVREHFNIVGPSVAQTQLVRNKLLMKDIVEAAGLAVPYNLSLANFMRSDSVNWSGKTVLKPIDGASSENVLVFDTPEQLWKALSTQSVGIAKIDEGYLDGYEVEQFICGDILHIDGLLFDGEIKLIISSKYIGNCLDFAKGQPLGSVQIDTSDLLHQWVQVALSAIGLTTGSFHLEAIMSDQGPVFLEVANRVGGADVVDAVEMATGVHLPSAELKAYLGESVDVSSQSPLSKKFGWFVFPGHHLDKEYCSIDHAELFKSNDMVVRWNQLTTEQPLTKTITYQSTEVPVAGLVGSECSNRLTDFMRDIFATVEVR